METRFLRGMSAAIFCALLAMTAVANDPACTLTASNGGPYCVGDAVSLYASSADPAATYTWSGPNNFNSNEQNPTIANGAPGTYSVTSNGCTQTTTVVVNPFSSITAPSHVTPESAGNTASGPDGASSYSWSISNGTITDGQHAQTVTFTAGAAGILTLTLDTVCSKSSQDISADPSPTISIGNASAQPGPKGTPTPFTFTVSLNYPSTQTVSVEYYTSNQTAIAFKDYQPASGTVVFQPLETSKTITVNVYGANTSTKKTFLVNLYNAVNATIQQFYGYPVVGKGTILAK
jgi:hypothetical protein